MRAFAPPLLRQSSSNQPKPELRQFRLWPSLAGLGQRSRRCADARRIAVRPAGSGSCYREVWLYTQPFDRPSLRPPRPSVGPRPPPPRLIHFEGVPPMHHMNFATAAVIGMIVLPALAQTPSGANPATGARPGHEPGVGESLPLSNKSSNITPTDTRSNIARRCRSRQSAKMRQRRIICAPPVPRSPRPHRAGTAVAGDGGDARTRSLGAARPDERTE
jgi:hypothetical protein